jgi:CheY-like chemotaxis protein
VDDNEIFREGLGVVLERDGFAPVLMANSRDALKYLLEATPPDLILIDMMMPVMDGWSFMGERRKIPRAATIPVVIVTALGAASWEWARSLGATGLVRKPVEAEEVVRVVRSFLCGKKEAASRP